MIDNHEKIAIHVKISSIIHCIAMEMCFSVYYIVYLNSLPD